MRTAISSVEKDGIPVIVVAQDIDILVLLCYYRPQDCVNLYLQAGCDNIFDISLIQIADREDILFKYRWSGNDTVSYIYGHTKISIYKNKYPSSLVTSFTNIDSSEKEIQKLGVKAMQITYGCGDVPLNHMCFLKFQKQASKGKVDPDRLPPTENATQQHALRAHHQIICWKS